MKKKLLIPIFLCAVFIFNAASYAASKTLADIKRQRDEIQAKVSNTQSEITAIQNNIYQTQLKILELDERLTIALDDLEVIDASVLATEARFNETQRQLEAAQQDRDRQFEDYKKRIRVMYEYGDASYLDILFQATSVSDFLTRLEYLNAIAKHDKEITQRLEESENKLMTMREEIDRQHNTLEELQYRQEVLTKEITDTLAEQNTFMVALLESEGNAEERLAIEREEERLAVADYNKAKKADDERRAEEARRRAEEQAAIQRQTILNYSGKLTWPAPSFTAITSHYGNRTHPIRGTREFHKGLDIASAMGTNIVAADGGTVVTSEYNWSYGNYVVIDHGGGLSTLYAHASKLLVNVGQRVSKGDVIAKVGSTGVSTGPHLHFEVHAGGQHTNPREYLNY